MLGHLFIYIFIFFIIWLNWLLNSVLVPMLALLSASGIGHNVTGSHKYITYISKIYCFCYQLHLISHGILPTHFLVPQQYLASRYLTYKEFKWNTQWSMHILNVAEKRILALCKYSVCVNMLSWDIGIKFFDHSMDHLWKTSCLPAWRYDKPLLWSMQAAACC